MIPEREMTLDEFIAARLPKMHGAALEFVALKAERDAAVKLLQELRSWHLNGNDDSEGRELIDAYLKARGEK